VRRWATRAVAALFSVAAIGAALAAVTSADGWWLRGMAAAWALIFLGVALLWWAAGASERHG